MTLYPFPERLRYEARYDVFTVEVGRLCNVPAKTVRRWLRDGLTWREADLLACRHGYHPRTLWPEWDMPFMSWERAFALEESWELRYALGVAA